MQAQMRKAKTMLDKRFTENWANEEDAKRAYEAHNENVRRSVPADAISCGSL